VLSSGMGFYRSRSNLLKNVPIVDGSRPSKLG
jgi:hypothetical protein